MRYIKFRGKRVDNGEWIYGYYVFYGHMGVLKHIIIINWAQMYTNSFYVEANTVGQYTGLKDKNGVEIYEYSELDGAYEVIFKDLKYSLRHIPKNDIIDLHDYWRDENGEIEVTREHTKV